MTLSLHRNSKHLLQVEGGAAEWQSSPTVRTCRTSIGLVMVEKPGSEAIHPAITEETCTLNMSIKADTKFLK